ncbi:MAG TPA: TetR family transcriptional regulator [Kineosporiaceae bacterium]|nr:TetR family transcriptional regulator [Kineosporiaceae bacterium]
MSRIPLPPRDPQVGTGSTGLDTRARIAASAFELFAAQGYDGTTVDAIAERAGIARRTFFRYFRSKDDVIFPDHDTLLATVNQDLALQSGVSPVQAICSGVRVVFRSYVSDPQVSVQRYRLTRSVDALRDRELATVRRYERAFSRYVRDRLAGGSLSESESVLRADVIAATVVAAHNAVLREWLRAGGDYDPMSDLETAFAWVLQTFEPKPMQRQGGQGDSGEPGTETENNGVVVAVFRADQPIGDVVDRISRSL